MKPIRHEGAPASSRIKPISSRIKPIRQTHHPEQGTFLIGHPERSEAESKDPVEVTLKITHRDPSTSLGMTT
jgi:hypothetical protein